MPRTVFRLVWDFLQRNRPVAGMVKNLAADGAYYWVVAVITPIRRGYLSIRFKPTGPLRATLETLYARMMDVEAAAAARGAAPGVGMDEAAAVLGDALGSLRFASYESFMCALVHDELKSRDAAIRERGAVLIPRTIASKGTRDLGRLQSIYQHYNEVYTRINTLYQQLDEYSRLRQDLEAQVRDVEQVTQDLRLVSLNAAIKSAQLGDEGLCIRVIADFLSNASAQIWTICENLDERARPVATSLETVIFHLASARLQLEMIMLFCHELASGTAANPADARKVRDLQEAFHDGLDLAIKALLDAEAGLKGFRGKSEEFRQLTMATKVAHINGTVEASRIGDAGSLLHTFNDVRKHTESYREKLSRLGEIMNAFERLASESPAIVGEIRQATRQAESDVEEFLALIAGPAGSNTGLPAPVMSDNPDGIAEPPTASSDIPPRAGLAPALA